MSRRCRKQEIRRTCLNQETYSVSRSLPSVTEIMYVKKFSSLCAVNESDGSVDFSFVLEIVVGMLLALGGRASWSERRVMEGAGGER